MRHKLKASFLIITVLLIALSTFAINPINASADSIEVDAEAAILVDAETGEILYAKNIDEMKEIASMTKMMTEYLVLEAINNGDINWDTTTQISDYPYSISADASFSGIGLIQDKDYTVKQLYEAMAINSDNATTIALAELIAGSESEFVKMMNDKAEELGLPAYDFVNSTGLNNQDLGDNFPDGTDPNAETAMSAKSTAMLAYHLIKDYPEVLEYSSQLTSELDDQTYENWNWMLPWDNDNFAQYYFEGVDGLKTGFTENAGNCFTGTAIRDGRRLISVVMDADSRDERFHQTKKLLEYGYSQFERQELYPAGYQIEGESVIPVAKGKEEVVEIASKDVLSSTVKNGEQESYSVTYNFDEGKLNDDGQLTAPIEKGEKVGTMELTYNGEVNHGSILSEGQAQSVDIITTSAIEKQNWFMLTLGGIGDFFSNIFSSIADTVKGWFS
ncbi:serine hydrolase [Aquibacillus rhizosphaerae]|uniref:serine-type D-Ala-D-Ala carboxypeptidase n=1 Tax=Aquibacillus rhizosphaerae TaxID=3051431 RepID=A0ABT7L4X0_9BACI|nr:serine hydrolase [Aquibacillus sp. LR5S19]MDL4840915.1 serine hydrolase [Aquibacillus sp. LR5S19]